MICLTESCLYLPVKTATPPVQSLFLPKFPLNCLILSSQLRSDTCSSVFGYTIHRVAVCSPRARLTCSNPRAPLPSTGGRGGRWQGLMCHRASVGLGLPPTKHHEQNGLNYMLLTGLRAGHSRSKCCKIGFISTSLPQSSRIASLLCVCDLLMRVLIPSWVPHPYKLI